MIVYCLYIRTIRHKWELIYRFNPHFSLKNILAGCDQHQDRLSIKERSSGSDGISHSPPPNLCSTVSLCHNKVTSKSSTMSGVGYGSSSHGEAWSSRCRFLLPQGATGYREILGVAEGCREDKESSRTFLRETGLNQMGGRERNIRIAFRNSFSIFFLKKDWTETIG